MKPKHQRMIFVALMLACIAGASALILTQLGTFTMYFRTPTELVALGDTSRAVRVGGLVEEGSVTHENGMIRFKISDGATTLPVEYKGALPSLFREGQGIVGEGKMVKGIFRASHILAKHDEYYMPPEVADSLKKQGLWREEEQ